MVEELVSGVWSGVYVSAQLSSATGHGHVCAQAMFVNKHLSLTLAGFSISGTVFVTIDTLIK